MFETLTFVTACALILVTFWSHKRFNQLDSEIEERADEIFHELKKQMFAGLEDLNGRIDPIIKLVEDCERQIVGIHAKIRDLDPMDVGQQVQRNRAEMKTLVQRVDNAIATARTVAEGAVQNILREKKT